MESQIQNVFIIGGKLPICFMLSSWKITCYINNIKIELNFIMQNSFIDNNYPGLTINVYTIGPYSLQFFYVYILVNSVTIKKSCIYLLHIS